MELRNLLTNLLLATSAAGESLPRDALEASSGPVLINEGRPNGVTKKTDGCLLGPYLPNQWLAPGVLNRAS